MKEMDATWTQMVFHYQEHPRTKVMMIHCSEELLETLEENQVCLYCSNISSAL